MIVTQPSDRDAEETVLGAMLVSAEATTAVLGIVRAEDFTASDNRLIFKAILDLRNRGLPTDQVAVKDELRRRNTLEKIKGGALYVAHLAETVPIPASAEHHARIVVEHADRRRLLGALHQASQAIERGADPGEVRSRLRATVADGGTPALTLGIADLPEVVRRVKEAGSASWLIEGLWPGDAYGVLGAEDKAGKSWALLDLAVSVATGTPWLGGFACPDPGPVLLFLGEGGERATVRRLSAISDAKGVSLGDVHAVRVTFRAPSLSDARALEAIGVELESHPARLVGLEPLYLSVPGGKGGDLAAMGEYLGSIQRVCQDAGAALAITHHWNQTGRGAGPERFTGAGPSAWGRVLGSAAVERRAQESDGTTDVLLRWKFTGSEIGDPSFRMRRRVRAEDPNDLNSRMVYSVEITEAGPESVGEPSRPPRQSRVLAVLEGTSETDSLTVREIGDRVAGDGQGRPLKERTIQAALQELAAEGVVDGEAPGPGFPGRWWRLAG